MKRSLIAGAVIATAAGGAYYLGGDFFGISPKPAIVGGELVPAGRLRSAVGLTYGNEKQPRCGGTLIAPDMILTAAHCLCQHTPKFAFIGENPFDPLNPSKRLYYRLGGSEPKSPPCANLAGAGMVDVAVIRIAGRVEATSPIAFADPAAIDAARTFLITGYGATDVAGTSTDFRKREAIVRVTSARCQGSDQATYGCNPDQEIVAGRVGTPDSCKGDSGSPLLISRTVQGREEYVVAGLVSRGINNKPGCGSGGIYERMTPATRQFIAGAMQRLRQ